LTWEFSAELVDGACEAVPMSRGIDHGLDVAMLFDDDGGEVVFAGAIVNGFG
jgi:hypothetical protein